MSKPVTLASRISKIETIKPDSKAMLKSKKRLLRLLDDKQNQTKVLNALKQNLKEIDSLGRATKLYSNAT